MMNTHQSATVRTCFAVFWKIHFQHQSYSTTLSKKSCTEGNFNNYPKKDRDDKKYRDPDLFKGDYKTRKVIFERAKYVQK